MILFKKVKDGGPDSPVDGYFLFEFKSLFSIVLLKFNKGYREAYHTHAFNAITWCISGYMIEDKFESNDSAYIYKPSVKPKITKRDNNHRVIALKDSWCISIRGPWAKTWTENNAKTGVKTVLTHGRKVVSID